MCFVLHKFLSALLLEANSATPSQTELHFQPCSDVLMNYLWAFPLFLGASGCRTPASRYTFPDTSAVIFSLLPSVDLSRSETTRCEVSMKLRSCWTLGPWTPGPQATPARNLHPFECEEKWVRAKAPWCDNHEHRLAGGWDTGCEMSPWWCTKCGKNTENEPLHQKIYQGFLQSTGRAVGGSLESVPEVSG